MVNFISHLSAFIVRKGLSTCVKQFARGGGGAERAWWLEHRVCDCCGDSEFGGETELLFNSNF